MRSWQQGIGRGLLLAPLGLLSGCAGNGFWLFHPQGAVATSEWHTTLLDVSIMGGVVAVAGGLVVLFLWRYRRTRTKRAYDPTFSASKIIELLVWGVPLIIVGFLSYFSVTGVLATNPYNPLAVKRAVAHRKAVREAFARRADPGTIDTVSPVGAAVRPIPVDVITTDWQWVFIYPQQGLATVDSLVVPVHTPIHFRLTSATVVNDFFIPELVGEIDVMPGMRTKQGMIAGRTGFYHGFSADFSGGGFSWMGFKTQVMTKSRFRDWVARVKAGSAHLTNATFSRLAQPTINLAEKPRYFSDVQKGLFDHVIEEVLAGKVYRTPLRMTEKMTKPMKVKLVK